MILPWLSIVAPHGYTDILTKPPLTVISTHAITLSVLPLIPYKHRFIPLIPASVIHLTNDFEKHIYIKSLILHFTWIFNHNLCKLYLSLIHTPKHYLALKHKKKRQITIGGLLLSLTLLFFEINVDLNMYNRLWVAPVLSHILLDKIIL